MSSQDRGDRPLLRTGLLLVAGLAVSFAQAETLIGSPVILFSARRSGEQENLTHDAATDVGEREFDGG